MSELPNVYRETIVDVTVRDQAKDIARLLRQRGHNVTAANLERKFARLAYQVVEAVAEQAKTLAEKNIPIDTGELRSDIVVECAGNRAAVFIPSVEHLGRRKHPEQASSLASFLNSANLRRSKDPSRSTKYWVTDTQIEIQRSLQPIIKKVLNANGL